MRKNLVQIALVGCFVILFCGAATAAGMNAMRIEVPFVFIAGEYVFPAGEYFVEMDRCLSNGNALGSSLVFTKTSEKARYIVTAFPTSTLSQPQARMTFHRYGNRYFLTNVESSGLKSRLLPTRAEKELAAKTSPAETVSVATD